MLSLFPFLFAWNWYVPFVFRLFLGYYFFTIGLRFEKSELANGRRLAPYFLMILAVLLTLGVYTQVCGLVAAISSLWLMFKRNGKDRAGEESRKFYSLLGIISLSLLFLGAGPYAFDIPL